MDNKGYIGRSMLTNHDVREAPSYDDGPDAHDDEHNPGYPGRDDGGDRPVLGQ